MVSKVQKNIVVFWIFIPFENVKSIYNTDGYFYWELQPLLRAIPFEKLGARMSASASDNFPIPLFLHRSLFDSTFFGNAGGDGMLGTPPIFYGVVKYHSTPTFLGVLPFFI